MHINSYLIFDVHSDGQSDRASSTRLLILIKDIFTLYGRKRFLPW